MLSCQTRVGAVGAAHTFAPVAALAAPKHHAERLGGGGYVVAPARLNQRTEAAVEGPVQPDPETDIYLSETYIHGNTFTGNGTAPQSLFALLDTPVEDVVWDGIIEPKAAATLCFSEDGEIPSFRNFNGIGNIPNSEMHSTDTGPYECEGTTVDEQEDF